jgi:hypothetical protein
MVKEKHMDMYKAHISAMGPCILRHEKDVATSTVLGITFDAFIRPDYSWSDLELTAAWLNGKDVPLVSERDKR